MAKFKPLPPLEELRKAFDYDPGTGLFWSRRMNRAAGTSKNTGGYVMLYRKRHLLAHRVAWFLETGQDPLGFEIDHKNRKVDDNRIINLRMATSAENSWNTEERLGCYFRSDIQKWQARITINKRRINLGHFLTVREARAAYYAKAIELRGEFAPQAWR